MIGKKINQLATELAPVSTDLTIIGDPTTGVSKKITLAQLGAIFSGAVSFYTNLAGFPATGDINVIYCAKDTQKLYLWSGSAYVEVFPSQALLDTYQLRSEKGVSNGYASLDSSGKVPISQLPSSIMEYKGTWNAATNTPTLANGTGDTGDVYICNVAGTVNFGAGPITFAVGDYTIYSGSIWQRSSGAVGTVTSVAVSRSGDALAITGSPITTSGTINIGFAGTGTQYIKGDGTLATFPSIISQAQNLITEVYNNTGATLTKGTIVYINGGQGNLPTVTKALATGDSTSAQTYGVVQTDITNMNNGYVVVAGRISDLDTQAYSNGTQLYLSPTTAGTWTSTKPYAPQHLVYVGIVVRAHPTQGVVEVKIQNGYEMDELHNVSAQSPDNNDILQYKTSTSLWTKVAGTTSNIAEGSNLYYTDARSRAALSFTAGSGAYNSTTGVITIPTNTNQLTNGAAYITLGSLSAGAGISYNNTTGVIASTITQYTDAMARASISLTTTGTSGAATYNSTTGVLNVPQYAPDLSGYVPTSRTLTINGTAYDLSANRSWSVGTVTSVGLSSATSGVSIGSTPVTTSGTITIAIATASGTQQGLLSSTDWTTFNNKASTAALANYLPLAGGTLTGALNGTNAIFTGYVRATAGVSDYTELRTDGIVAVATDLYIEAPTGRFVSISAGGTEALRIASNLAATFNSSVTASSFIKSGGTSSQYLKADGSVSTLTNPVTGTGTTNYLPKFTGTSTIGNSQVFDNGTNVGIGTATPVTKLDVIGNQRLFPSSGDVSLTLRGFASQYLAFTEASVADRGVIGFAVGSGDLVYRSGGYDMSTGTMRLTLTSSGNLGLGVTPSAWVDYKGFQIGNQGSIGATSTVINFSQNVYYGASGNSYIENGKAAMYQMNDGVHGWRIAGTGTAGNAISFTQAMTLDANGNLAIGTTSASSRLHVVGTSLTDTFRITDAANYTIVMGYAGSGNTGLISTLGGTASLALGTNSTARLTIASTGAATFSVNTNASLLITNTGQTPIISFRANGVTAAGKIRVDEAFGGGEMVFSTKTTGGVDTDRIIINSSGNVGIGTTSPSARLSISDVNYSPSSADTYNINVITTTPQSPSRGGSIGLGGETGGGGFVFGAIQGAKENINFADTSGYLAFFTRSNGSNPAERMRITSGGNVGIGTTSPAGKLDIAAGTGANILIAGEATNLVSINNYSSASGFQDLKFVGANQLFFTGTAGGGSASERMRITSGGRVLIGTTSDTGVGGLCVSNTSFNGGANGLITMIGNSESSIMFQTAGYGADTNKILLDNTTGSFQFRINSAERLRITSGGNLNFNYSGATAYVNINQATSSDGGLLFLRSINNRWQQALSTSGDNLLFYSYGVGNTVLSLNYSTGAATFTGDVKVKKLEVTNATTYGSSGGISTYMQITVNGNNYVIPLHQTP